MTEPDPARRAAAPRAGSNPYAPPAGQYQPPPEAEPAEGPPREPREPAAPKPPAPPLDPVVGRLRSLLGLIAFYAVVQGFQELGTSFGHDTHQLAVLTLLAGAFAATMAVQAVKRDTWVPFAAAAAAGCVLAVRLYVVLVLIPLDIFSGLIVLLPVAVIVQALSTPTRAWYRAGR